MCVLHLALRTMITVTMCCQFVNYLRPSLMFSSSFVALTCLLPLFSENKFTHIKACNKLLLQQKTVVQNRYTSHYSVAAESNKIGGLSIWDGGLLTFIVSAFVTLLTVSIIVIIALICYHRRRMRKVAGT